MADSQLKLKITTALDNAGLKLTEKQINAITKEIEVANAKGEQMAKGLTREIGKVPGEVGKLTKSISGLAGAFGVSGGIGLAIAGITTAIGLVKKYFDDAKEKAKELAKAISDSIGKEIDNISDKIKGFVNKGDTIKKNVSNQLKYQNDLRDIANAGDQAKAEQEFLNKLDGITNKFERERLQAEHERDKAIAASDANLQKLKDQQTLLQKEQNADIRTYGQAQLDAKKGQPLVDEMKNNPLIREYRNALGVLQMVTEEHRKTGQAADRFAKAQKDVQDLEKKGAKELYDNFTKASKELEQNKDTIAKLNEAIDKRAKDMDVVGKRIEVEEQNASNAIKKAQMAYDEKIKTINENELKSGTDEKVKDLKEKERQAQEDINKLKEQQKIYAKDIKDAEKNLKDALEKQQTNATMGFNDWEKGELGKDKDASKRQRNFERNRASAMRKLQLLEGRGSMTTQKDRQRIERLKEFLGDTKIDQAKQDLEDARERERIRADREQKRTDYLREIKIALDNLQNNSGI